MRCMLCFCLIGCIERVPSADPDDFDGSPADGATTDATELADASPDQAQPIDSPDQFPPCVPAAFATEDVRSATFIGEHLYVDGPGGVTVGRVTPSFITPLGPLLALTQATAPDAPDRATLFFLEGRTYARLTVHESGRRVVEAFDLSNPLNPRPLSGFPQDDLQNPHRAVGTVDGWLIMCFGGAFSLIRPVPHADGVPDGDQVILASGANICARDGLVIGGAQVLSWDQGEGARVPSFQLNTVEGDQVTQHLDFGFNPGGVHRYGDVVGAAVGPRRAVIDVESTRYSWLLDLTGEGNRLNELDFPLDGDPALLGFVGDLVLRGSPEGLVAIDVSDATRPRPGPTWPLAAGPEQPHLLAVGEAHFAVRDPSGRLSVLPRVGGSPVPVEGCR